MIIVSDTSVISGLILINKLSILHDIFDQIIIPPKVYAELIELENFGVAVRSLIETDWIEVQHPIDLSPLSPFDLDEGEKEAIALALEINADFLLIDETYGRQVARHLGLTITGLIGILIKAKNENVIRLVKPLLDALQANGFWISSSLYKHALRLAGE